MMENTFNVSIRHIDQKLKDQTRFNNWDQKKAKAISSDLWNIAELFLNYCAIDPVISPCPCGKIHLEWFVGTDTYMLEIDLEDMFWHVADKNGYGFYKRITTIGEVQDEMRNIKVLREGSNE